MSDLKDQFDAYRAKAMAGNEGPFAAMEAGYAALNAFVLEDWPDLSTGPDPRIVKLKQIGHGHRDGSLEQLTFEVSDVEAIGWRRVYDMTYDRESRAWVPSRRS